jgi:hypothetical protein
VDRNGCRRELRAADILTAGDDTRDERADRGRLLRPERGPVEHVARHHALLHHVLHVDGRGLAGDRDRFLDRATRRSAFTVAANEADNSMPSRFTVLKPVSVNVTV